MIPAGYPEGMADELKHCINTLGCKAAHLVSYTLDRQMDDPVFFPFYEAAENSTSRFSVIRARLARPER